MTEIFEDSKLKLTRARYHLESLAADMKEYAATAKIIYEPIQGDDENVIFKIDPDASKLFALIIGDIVHNIRSALDILICDIGRMRSKTGCEKFYFPFDENKEKLLHKLQTDKKLKRLDFDIVQAIEALKPYKINGNIDFMGLHELDKIDKHRLVLPTVQGVFGKIDYNQLLNDHGIVNPDTGLPLKILRITDGSDRVLEVGAKAAKEFSQKYIDFQNGEIALLFPKEFEFFSGQHVLPTLVRLGQMVEDIVQDFEKKFGELN